MAGVVLVLVGRSRPMEEQRLLDCSIGEIIIAEQDGRHREAAVETKGTISLALEKETPTLAKIYKQEGGRRKI